MPAEIEEAEDRIIVKLDPGGPVELSDLSESFAALARMYERHYGNESSPPPRLFVTKLETGSIIAEIAPYAMLLGSAVQAMGGVMTVSDFVRRLGDGIRAFSGARRDHPVELLPTRSDAADIREFMKPLAGKSDAMLRVGHARLERDERRTIVEYEFTEAEINRASLRIEEALSLPQGEFVDEPATTRDHAIHDEVMLFFEQASAKPGREKGRTGDRGVIPDVSPKALPVYFRKSFHNLKDQMVKGDLNPLTHAFVVDVHVQRVDGEPRAYIIADVHEVVPLEEK